MYLFYQIFPFNSIFAFRVCLSGLISQEVVDESDGCGGKFSVIVVSEQFAGKTLLQRHRLVNAALADELKTIHAFSQKTFTPEQWATEQQKQ